MRFPLAALISSPRRPLGGALALLLLPGLAAASGALDPRFAGDGIAIHDIGGNAGDRFFAGLIDAQGRPVGAGSQYAANTTRGGMVVRFTPKGALDASFGEGGVVRTPIPEATFDDLIWTDLAEYPDGRLLAAGYYASNTEDQAAHAYLCRFLPDGAPDPAFGTEGCAQPTIWPESVRDTIVAIALQPDGRVVLLGQTDFTAAVQEEYYVARLDEDGTLDRCFGDAGCQIGGVRIEPETAPDLVEFVPRDVALAPDGRIVIAGSSVGPQNVDMAAVRLLPTGGLDTDFGDGGHRLIAFDQGNFDFERAEAAAVAPDGRVFLVGAVQIASGQVGGATLLDAGGDIVASFGDAGRSLFFFNDVSPHQVAFDARLQADGKLVVAGTASDANPYGDCGVARLDAQGDLDPVFGAGGTLGIDANLGAEPMPLDDCHALDVRFGAILLFGSSGPTNLARDALVIKLDQDDLFRDGFEAAP